MKLSRKTIIERVSQRMPNQVFNEMIRSSLITKQDVETYGKRRLLTMLNEPKNDFIKKYLLVSYLDPEGAKQIFDVYKPGAKFWIPPRVMVNKNRFVFYDVDRDRMFMPPNRKINLSKMISDQQAGLIENIFKTHNTYKIGVFVIEMVAVMDHTIRIIRYLGRHMLRMLYSKTYKSPDGGKEDLETKEAKDAVYIDELSADVRPHLREILRFLPSLEEATRRFNDPELTSDINSLSNAVGMVISDLDTLFEDERWMNEPDFARDILAGTEQTEWFAERIKSGLVRADFAEVDTTDLHYNKNLPIFESKYMIATIKTIYGQDKVKRYSRKIK